MSCSWLDYPLPLTWEAFRVLGETAGLSLKCLRDVNLDPIDKAPKCPSIFSLFSALQSLDIRSSCEFLVDIDRIPKAALSNLAILSVDISHPSLYEVLSHMECVFVDVRRLIILTRFL